MERINPYAVMRNTATHDAYRAYCRDAAKAAWPFLIPFAIMPAFLPMAMVFGARLPHCPVVDWKWPLGVMIVWIALSVTLMGFGLVRMARFRREHPIPQAWRQVPRFSWPTVAGRR